MKHLTITVSRFSGLFVSAALFFVPVSATWGYDWVRTDGEPKIYCSQNSNFTHQVFDLTYSTGPDVDSPPATLVYRCYPLLPVREKNFECVVMNSTSGGTYQLNGSQKATFSTIHGVPNCYRGYIAMNIWAQKK